MSSYIKTTSCQKVVTKCCSGTLYSPQEDKDILISKLSSKINELEEKEKNFELLNQEYKQLENDYTLLNEAKLRLEYEIKQRNEAYNKRICDLKSDKENLQNALNDKMCVNKKLLEEKKCLENQLKKKNNEIDDINNKLNNLNNKLNLTQSNNDELQNNLRELNDIKAKQRDKIADLVNDNKRLAKICQEQDHSLYLAAQEKDALNKKLRDDNSNINNLNSKLRTHGNNLNNLQKQLDNSNDVNLRLKNNVQNLENELNNYQIDNDNLKNELCQERIERENEDKNNEQLKCILCDRQNKIKCLNHDYERLKLFNQKINEDKSIYHNENDKLKEHIMILTRQNQDLTSEIDNIIKDDEYMKNILKRIERMSFTLKENDSVLSNIPNEIMYECNENNYCLDLKENKLCLNNSNATKEKTCSSRYTYVLEQK